MKKQWKIISNDDQEQLVFKTSNHSINNITINKHTWIEFCCICGATNCFKYLLANEKDVTNCAKPAVYGGNEEICQLCAEKGCSFDNCLLTAFKAHQEDIAQWLIGNYQVESNIVIL